MSCINIITQKCVGCKLCIGACPFNAIEVTERKAKILDNCTLCGSCVSACKFNAIELIKDEEQEASDLSSYKGVWVFAEHRSGEVCQIAFELLGSGRKLADDLSVPLSAVLIGSDVEKEA